MCLILLAILEVGVLPGFLVFWDVLVEFLIYLLLKFPKERHSDDVLEEFPDR